MTKTFIATTKAAAEPILKRAAQKRKWLRALEKFGTKYGVLNKKKPMPCYKHFDEITIIGFYFMKDPGRLWKKDKDRDSYSPSKSTKSGREIAAEFDKIRKFDFKDVKKALKGGSQFTSNKMMDLNFWYCAKRKVAGVYCSPEYVWTPPRGFKEITHTQYEKAIGETPKKKVS